MIATFTSCSDKANVNVSSSRQRYKAGTTAAGRLRVSRVFTIPGRGAFAMITSVRCLFRNVIWLSLSLPQGSAANRVKKNAAQYEPCSSDRSLYSAADFRSSDPRMVADWHFYNPQAFHSPFHDHLNRPTICLLSEIQYWQRRCANSAKRAEIADPHAIESTDEAGRESVAEHSVLRHGSAHRVLAEPRTYCDIRVAFDDRREQLR